MEAGSSCLQTTDPRVEVEKVVMDGLEERKQEEEVQVSSEGEDECQTDETSRDETSRKGKGKGTVGKGEHDSKGRLGSKGVRWEE